MGRLPFPLSPRPQNDPRVLAVIATPEGMRVLMVRLRNAVWACEIALTARLVWNTASHVRQSEPLTEFR